MRTKVQRTDGAHLPANCGRSNSLSVPRMSAAFDVNNIPVGCSTTTRAVRRSSHALSTVSPRALTRHDIFDNVTLYWLTNTHGLFSARLYWESKLAFFAPNGVPIPAAVSVFLDEIYAAPKSLDRLSQTDSLQPTPERRTLRRVGAAGTFRCRTPRGV